MDVFLWSLVRYHAVRAGVLTRTEVEADFVALGQGGALAPTSASSPGSRSPPRSPDEGLAVPG